MIFAPIVCHTFQIKIMKSNNLILNINFFEKKEFILICYPSRIFSNIGNHMQMKLVIVDILIFKKGSSIDLGFK